MNFLPLSAESRAAVRELVVARSGKKWCLFLDRDGVINRQIVGDYVRTWMQFEWLEGAPLALLQLRKWAPHLVVVTNQQGVGKGLMSIQDVDLIHRKISDRLAAEEVSVDGFRVCPHLESAGCNCRKPAPGLVLDWLQQHPDVDPALSVVVGDSWGDMELARHVSAATGGCAKIQIGDKKLGGTVDAAFHSLWDFALAVGNAREDFR
jgi:histidinol-phosphate phosphatase family protein